MDCKGTRDQLMRDSYLVEVLRERLVAIASRPSNAKALLIHDPPLLRSSFFPL